MNTAWKMNLNAEAKLVFSLFMLFVCRMDGGTPAIQAPMPTVVPSSQPTKIGSWPAGVPETGHQVNKAHVVLFQEPETSDLVYTDWKKEVHGFHPSSPRCTEYPPLQEWFPQNSSSYFIFF